MLTVAIRNRANRSQRNKSRRSLFKSRRGPPKSLKCTGDPSGNLTDALDLRLPCGPTGKLHAKLLNADNKTRRSVRGPGGALTAKGYYRRTANALAVAMAVA